MQHDINTLPLYDHAELANEHLEQARLVLDLLAAEHTHSRAYPVFCLIDEKLDHVNALLQRLILKINHIEGNTEPFSIDAPLSVPKPCETVSTRNIIDHHALAGNLLNIETLARAIYKWGEAQKVEADLGMLDQSIGDIMTLSAQIVEESRSVGLTS